MADPARTDGTQTIATAELAVLDHLPDPIILLSAERIVTFANKAALEILSAPHLGRDLAQSLRHPEALALADAALRGAAEQSAEIDLFLPMPRVFRARALAMPDIRPALRRALLIFEDITEARQIAQMREEFVANVSHELRSPIAALVGFIETLRGPARDDKQAHERFLGIMADEADRMSRLINDLLSLTRVEAGEHVRPREAVDVGRVLGAVRELVAGRAAEQQMDIRLQIADGLPTIPGDRDELSQVFHNLIENALNYGRPGTPIVVDAAVTPRIPYLGVPGISVAVENQGDGIAEEHIPRLTERFYRADEGRSRKLGGTGLGLAIVKHIVNHHRGRLAIESEVGKGAKFTVFLPSAG